MMILRIYSLTFSRCQKLKIIEIHEDLKLNINIKNLLHGLEQVIIMVPVKLIGHIIEAYQDDEF